ncbi:MULTISPECIES: alpha/beta hydrolase [unclassified Nocardiopsis]|uniref:alpha/beta hydrolase n=1 Tax=unclassified Nocardiopsis TaxID=2649073 RepID=UPI001F468BE1|nr:MULTISPECIES: alpha/beta hydrolase [unclassified Nocardiopsis]
MAGRRGGRARRVLRGAALALALVLVVAAGGFLVWAYTPHTAEEGPYREAVATPGVEVTATDAGVVLAPADARPGTGVVFYPGARVEPEAYAAVWAPIVADSGVLVVVPRMPLNLAVFAPGRAGDVFADHVGVGSWYVGGHSLGGAMAASYAGGAGTDTVDGLVLWASYATEGAGLGGREDLAVLSVSGSRDGLADPAAIEGHRSHLPADAFTYEVTGMNHAQFGSYGEQRGDDPATIGDAEAHRELAAVTAGFLSGSW